MQLVALFPQRAAADRARIRLVESGIAPGQILTVDKRTDDFLIEDEQSDSQMSFWAHMNTMLDSEGEMAVLQRKLQRGACLLAVRAPADQVSTVSSVLESAGARAQWKRAPTAPIDRDDRCSTGRL